MLFVLHHLLNKYLGEPNVVTYGIDKNDINEIKDIEDVRDLGEVSLAYYKNVYDGESTKALTSSISLISFISFLSMP